VLLLLLLLLFSGHQPSCAEFLRLAMQVPSWSLVVPPQQGHWGMQYEEELAELPPTLERFLKERNGVV
jgi:hypothetical protein